MRCVFVTTLAHRILLRQMESLKEQLDGSKKAQDVA
jgi:hypothetical protein